MGKVLTNDSAMAASCRDSRSVTWLVKNQRYRVNHYFTTSGIGNHLPQESHRSLAPHEQRAAIPCVGSVSFMRELLERRTRTNTNETNGLRHSVSASVACRLSRIPAIVRGVYSTNARVHLQIVQRDSGGKHHLQHAFWGSDSA